MVRTAITMDVYKAGRDVPVMGVQVAIRFHLIVLKVQEKKLADIVMTSVEILDTVLLIVVVVRVTVPKVVPHVPLAVT